MKYQFSKILKTKIFESCENDKNKRKEKYEKEFGTEGDEEE